MSVSLETLVREKVTSDGLDYSVIRTDTGRIMYAIGGKTYIPKEAVDTFLDGGWEANYHDL